MNAIRTILADDERAGRTRLRRMLEKERDIEVIAECSDGVSTVRAIQEHHPELIFLDIRMPGMDGFAVLDALGPAQGEMAVVFVTAYDEHAVRAFEACALDYLLKPASQERLAKALTRARAHVQSLRQAKSRPDRKPAANEKRDEPSAQRFLVRGGSRISFIAPEEIDWVEAAGNYAILHASGANHMIRETMSALENQLGSNAFLRVSRSAIVNLRRVKELRATATGEHEAILHTDARIPITRAWREVADRLARL